MELETIYRALSPPVCRVNFTAQVSEAQSPEML